MHHFLPFGRNLKLVPWGKSTGSSKFKESFSIPHYHLPTLLRRCLSCRHSIMSTWFSLTLAGKSQTPSGFPVLGPQEVFLFSFLQISRYTGHHSACMSPLINAPKDFSAGTGLGMDKPGGRRLKCSMRPISCDAMQDPSLPCSPRLCRGLWPSPTAKGDFDSLTPWPWYHLSPETEGQHTVPFFRRLTLPLRSLASHLTPLSSELVSRPGPGVLVAQCFP